LRRSSASLALGPVFHDDDHVLRTLTKLLDDASSVHRKLDPADGLQNAQFDDGARVHIVHRDIARGGHALANVGKFTGVPRIGCPQPNQPAATSRKRCRFTTARSVAPRGARCRRPTTGWGRQR
jgi:hypothetical protein